MAGQITFSTIPDIIVVLGTDAAGKDHIANLLAKMITEAGGNVEKRKRYLTGKITSRETSAGKSAFELTLERIFLTLFPIFGFVLPWCLTHLLKRDIRKFKQPGKHLIIVGHNCIRGLAFWWGHRYVQPEQIRLSTALNDAFAEIRAMKGIYTIVLDIEDKIRKQRIALRETAGEADNFDRYLAENEQRSESIENFLVWISQTHLQGLLIENNDLSEDELRSQIVAGYMPKDTDADHQNQRNAGSDL